MDAVIVSETVWRSKTERRVELWKTDDGGVALVEADVFEEHSRGCCLNHSRTYQVVRPLHVARLRPNGREVHYVQPAREPLPEVDWPESVKKMADAIRRRKP